MKNNWIKKSWWIISIFILFGCTHPKDDLKITYIANCGFLFEYQSSKVLIDPFGTKYGDRFDLPTNETKINIEEGITPFDNIDLVLISHIHGDHFNPFVTEQFLLNNENAKLICPPQVFNQMKDSCVNLKQIETQIIVPQISMNEMETIEFNHFSVTAIRMQHGAKRSLEGIEYKNYTNYEKTENLGYLIGFDNKVIFHHGDASLKINKQAINNLNRKVDIAYLSFFDWDSISYNLLKENLHAKEIVFMHGTKQGKELETEEFKSILPNLIFFQHKLESRIIK